MKKKRKDYPESCNKLLLEKLMKKKVLSTPVLNKDFIQYKLRDYQPGY